MSAPCRRHAPSPDPARLSAADAAPSVARQRPADRRHDRGRSAHRLLRTHVDLPLTRELLPPGKFPLGAENFTVFSLAAVVALGLSGFYDFRVSPRRRPTLFLALPLQMALVAIAGTLLEVSWRSRFWKRRGFSRGARSRRGSGRGSGAARSSSARRLELLELRGPHGFLCRPSAADALVTDAPFGSIGEDLLVQVSMPGAYGVGAVLKRAVDVALGSILVVAASPFFAAIAALVAIDSRGPVLLRQRRTGLRGAPLLMWKFRTTHVDHAGSEFALDDDVRVTRVGRWLRRYRLDELPQLLNVVEGGMSLVGPRPEMSDRIAVISREVPHFGLRLFVRPCLAGLAQTSAEYDQPPSVKLIYDLQYLCSWTPVLDFTILVRAVVTALSGRGV